MRSGFGAALLLLVITSTNELHAEETRVAVTVILHGEVDATQLGAELERDNTLPIDLVFAKLPNRAPSTPNTGALDLQIGDARAAYIDARFGVCLERIGSDRALHDELGALRPERAARLLFWRIACRVGAGDMKVAQDDARRFAALELDIPPDVASVTPDVESILAAGARDVAAGQRVPLRVDAPMTGSSVSIDGRAGVCTTPCTLSPYAGEHVIRVDADGYRPGHRLVRASADEPDHFIETATASPELAATQWTQRYGSTAQLDAVASMRLLSRAVRARRLVLLHAIAGAHGLTIVGALTVDGTIAARSERAVPTRDELFEPTREVLRDLLVTGRVLEPPPPLTEQPLFWIAISAAAIVAGAVTTALLYEPNTRTEVVFR